MLCFPCVVGDIKADGAREDKNGTFTTCMYVVGWAGCAVEKFVLNLNGSVWLGG